MSSTIHSLGPKPASGLSCELVAWVDTSVIASSTRARYRESEVGIKATLRDAGGRHRRPPVLRFTDNCRQTDNQDTSRLRRINVPISPATIPYPISTAAPTHCGGLCGNVLDGEIMMVDATAGTITWRVSTQSFLITNAWISWNTIWAATVPIRYSAVAVIVAPIWLRI